MNKMNLSDYIVPTGQFASKTQIIRQNKKIRKMKEMSIIHENSHSQFTSKKREIETAQSQFGAFPNVPY